MTVKIISKPFVIAAAATATAVGLGGYVWHENNRPPILEVYVFAVPGGQSIFIRTPDDRRVLIDGGSNAAIIRELTQVLPFYSRRIDAVIATSDSINKVTGLIEAINRYNIGQAFIAAVTLTSVGIASTTDPVYKTFLDSIDTNRIPLEELKIGDHITFGAKVSADIIFPADPKEFDYSKASAPEIFMSLSFGSVSIILAGGASNKVQKYLAGNASSTLQGSSSGAIGDDSNQSVLVVSQSALPSNLSREFTEKVNPKYLIYSKAAPKISSKSVSKNAKSKPDPLASIDADHRFNIREKGIVKITSDGVSIVVSQKK